MYNTYKQINTKQHSYNNKACTKGIQKEVNFDVINNVMTFLTMRVKVKTVYRFKRPYIFMDNGDNFMKFAE